MKTKNTKQLETLDLDSLEQASGGCGGHNFGGQQFNFSNLGQFQQYFQQFGFDGSTDGNVQSQSMQQFGNLGSTRLRF